MGPYFDHQVGRFEAPDREILAARARQARAEATADMFGALYAGLKTIAAGGGGVRALRRRRRRPDAAAPRPRPPDGALDRRLQVTFAGGALRQLPQR